jgi:hypothetical protein
MASLVTCFEGVRAADRGAVRIYACAEQALPFLVAGPSSGPGAGVVAGGAGLTLVLSARGDHRVLAGAMDWCKCLPEAKRAVGQILGGGLTS